MGKATGQRKEQRVAGCKPVIVSGEDRFGSPFSLNTFTMEFAASGARLRGLPPVRIGAVLLLESGGQSARHRVMWIGEPATQYEGHVGLANLDLDKFIFGVQPAAPGSFYDEYNRIEAELHRSQERYRSLFENSVAMIYTHDMQGLLLTINPATSKWLDCPTDMAPGKNLAEFLALSQKKKVSDYLARLEQTGEDQGHVLVVGSRTKYVWFYRNVVVRERGNPPYVVGHAMDVTEEKRTQRRLQRTLGKLQSALAEVKTLHDLLPTCAWCRRIHDEDGSWTSLEIYVHKHAGANFSHGICPDCVRKVKS